jgi:superfamily II DNA or RNA helicase
MLTIQWFNGDLLIENPTPCLKKLLRYEHKSLVQLEGSYDRKTVKEWINLWAEVPDRPTCIVTYQGLIDEVTAHCKTQKIPFTVQDLRLKLPPPKLHAVKGFRGTQFTMFATAIRAGRSGIIEAPTRYGKSSLILNYCRAYEGMNIVITAPGVDLLAQLHAELKVAMPTRDIKGIYTGSKNSALSEDITICSMDSLEKLNPQCVRLVLIDEVHAACSPTRIPVLNSFKNATFVGFGATPEGRFDGTDRVTRGLIGPVIARKTFREAVAEGAICDIHVWMIKIKYDPFWAFNRNKAYEQLVHKNRAFMDIVAGLTNQIIPSDWQTLIFIDNKKQAAALKEVVCNTVVAIADDMKVAERRESFRGMVANETKRCICTNIYSQGVTFPDIRVLVNCAGGGGSITGVQKPGRLAQIRPNKKYGHMIDFLFEMTEPPAPVRLAHEGMEKEKKAKFQHCKMPMIDSLQRLAVYKKKGYIIHYVDNFSQINLD